MVEGGTDNDIKTQCPSMKGCGRSPFPKMAEPGTLQPTAQPCPPSDSIAALTHGDVYDTVWPFGG